MEFQIKTILSRSVVASKSLVYTSTACLTGILRVVVTFLESSQIPSNSNHRSDVGLGALWRALVSIGYRIIVTTERFCLLTGHSMVLIMKLPSSQSAVTESLLPVIVSSLTRKAFISQPRIRCSSMVLYGFGVFYLVSQISKCSSLK